MKNNDLMEDALDAKEIKKQKEELSQTKDQMAKWKFGKGPIKGKDDINHDVRN